VEEGIMEERIVEKGIVEPVSTVVVEPLQPVEREVISDT
jgi:hypothetical protein